MRLGNLIWVGMVVFGVYATLKMAALFGSM